MSDHYKESARQIILALAGQFIAEESNRSSLITPTNVIFSDRGKRAAILVSVLPDTQEKAVLDFLKRKKNDFRAFVKKESKLRILPYFTFDIDQGEKNRQRIDDLLNSE